LTSSSARRRRVSNVPTIAARYDVGALPTLTAFEGGEPAAELVGRRDRETVESII